MCDEEGKKKKMHTWPDMQVGMHNGNNIYELKKERKESTHITKYVSKHT